MNRLALEAYKLSLGNLLEARRISNDLDAVLYDAQHIVDSSFSPTEQRSQGMYFTPRSLASQVVARIRGPLRQGCTVFDPAMGGGDLLIAAADVLPLGPSLSGTLRLWSRYLCGFDIHAEFIEIAKLRLGLLARLRLGSLGGISPKKVLGYFPNFHSGDFLTSDPLALERGACIVMNPPFSVSSQRIPSRFSRSTKLSAAALFLEQLYPRLPVQTQLVAILPEVIRCGSTYRRLRNDMAMNVKTLIESSLPRFSHKVDIDVFIGHYVKHFKSQAMLPTKSFVTPLATLSDKFEIRVGGLVPHRTPSLGPWRRYITAKTVPAWSEGFTPRDSRRYAGKVVPPPFVVVRRTSRPARKFRAVASVIIGYRDIAVENHLIVLRPIDGTLGACIEAIKMLAKPSTNEHLDNIMRCRHLTTSSLATLEYID
jgi:hypothetical protein